MADQPVARALLALAEQQRIANRIAFHQLTRALDHREQKALAEDIYRPAPPTPKDEAEERDPWATDWGVDVGVLVTSDMDPRMGCLLQIRLEPHPAMIAQG